MSCNGCSGPGGLKVGSQVSRRSTVVDGDGNLTDATMEWEVRLPDGSLVPGNPVHEGLGSYLSTFPIATQAGIYHWEIRAEGPVFRTESGKFRVAPSDL